MNNGAFGENFPYSNFHDLNMDWIIQIAKDFLDQYTHIQQIIEDGKTDIQNLTEQGISDLTSKAEELEQLLQEWYNTHSEDIANQLAEALSDLEDWYTEHEGFLNDITAQKIHEFEVAITAKGQQTLESIPDDYTALSNRVATIEDHDTFYGEKFDELDNGYTIYPANWERGSIRTDTGEDATNAQRIRTVAGADIRFNDQPYLIVTCPQSYQIASVILDENGNVVGTTTWKTGKTVISRNRPGYSDSYSVRLMCRAVTDPTVTVVPVSIGDHIKTFAPTFPMKIQLIAYVNRLGGDDYYNDGLSPETPFKTLQYAIDCGFKNISVASGYTYEGDTLNITGGNNIHIFRTPDGTYTGEPQLKPILSNGTKISSLTTDAQGYYKFTPTVIPERYTKVFVNHTLPPIASGTRPYYNAGLWVIADNYATAKRLKPVVTYGELSESNTFYFDGTDVYANTNLVDSHLHMVMNSQNVLQLTDCHNCTIEGFGFICAIGTNASILRSTGIKFTDCLFMCTLNNSSVVTNYSECTFDQCTSMYAGVDGWNVHYYGRLELNDCIACYNDDDGESGHEYTFVTILGGEYHHNGKGGHSPVNGCTFMANGSYTHDNPYGFYMVGSESFSKEKPKLINCLAVNNSTKDIMSSRYDSIIWNTIYNTIQGTYTDFNN